MICTPRSAPQDLHPWICTPGPAPLDLHQDPAPDGPRQLNHPLHAIHAPLDLLVRWMKGRCEGHVAEVHRGGGGAMVEGAAEILVEGLGKEGGEGGHDLQEGGGGG